MTVAYHGGDFHGFAPQPGLRTVGGTLTETLSRITGYDVDLTCAGRTDAGVHAWGQVLSTDLPAAKSDLDRLQRSLNMLCAPSIVVRDIEVVPVDFHARYSARSRLYRYCVLNRRVPDPFLEATSWWVPQTLDLHALVMACDPFIGRHDFTSFCKRDKGRTISPPSYERRVTDARWEEAGDGVLHFWIEANAFCHQMVRSIVGTLVDVGLGKIHAGDVRWIMLRKDRQAAGAVAPPQGLVLWEVGYP